MHPIKAKKQELKLRAKLIRTAKQSRKTLQDGWFGDLPRMRNDYRHYHIAYCEVRGRTREQIEKPAEGNEPDERRIDMIKRSLLWNLEHYDRERDRIVWR
jgi:hypothetical protein